MTLHSEIFEQPERLGSLLEKQRPTVLEIAKAIQSRNVQYAFLAARGTSDNAGRYANYLWGAHNRMPLALATPSLFTYYQSPPRLQGALVIGVSQSGQSPDIVSVLAKAEREGQLRERIRFLCRTSLLIVDEIGYLPVIPGGGNLFFQLVNARYERGAMILTSNRGFAEWGDVFGGTLSLGSIFGRRRTCLRAYRYER